MNELTSLPVEFLCNITATLNPPIVVPGGPNGTRVIVRVTGGTVTGPRLNGTVEDLGADWLTMRADGTAQLDVRIVITTDDGVPIHVSYKGIMAPDANGVPRIVTAPLFETGDERYTWLTQLQAIAVGTTGKGTVEYNLYQLV
jgi:hypothetical protein